MDDGGEINYGGFHNSQIQWFIGSAKSFLLNNSVLGQGNPGAVDPNQSDWELWGSLADSQQQQSKEQEQEELRDHLLELDSKRSISETEICFSHWPFANEQWGETHDAQSKTCIERDIASYFWQSTRVWFIMDFQSPKISKNRCKWFQSPFSHLQITIPSKRFWRELVPLWILITSAAIIVDMIITPHWKTIGIANSQ